MDTNLMNEELIINDMSELEQDVDVEYYIDFIGLDKTFNGMCKIINILQNDYWGHPCVVTKLDHGITFIISSCKSSGDILLGYFSTNDLRYFGCNIYKIPTTEYVLK
jgi:hypothetical protein